MHVGVFVHGQRLGTSTTALFLAQGRPGKTGHISLGGNFCKGSGKGPVEWVLGGQ